MNRRSLFAVIGSALASLGPGRHIASGRGAAQEDTGELEFFRLVGMVQEQGVPIQLVARGTGRRAYLGRSSRSAVAVLRQYRYVKEGAEDIVLHPTDTFTDWLSPTYIEWNPAIDRDPVRAVFPGVGYRPSWQIVGFTAQEADG